MWEMFSLIFWRSLLLAGGLFAAGWSISTFSIFWKEAALDRVAAQVTEGEPFKREVLESVLDESRITDGWARPEGLRSRAIIELRLVEDARSAGSLAPVLVDSLEIAIRKSLAVAPSDSFLWLALFSLKGTRGDQSPGNFDDLRMSHRVGPNEGWVAIRRVAVEFSAYPDLPGDLTKAAVENFFNLVRSGYLDAAVEILAGPGKPLRDELLRGLRTLPSETQLQFSLAAHRHGYDSLSLPQDPAAARPWR